MQQLTSLANVKSWLSVDTANDDALLQRLINQATRYILNSISRPNLNRQTYTETKNGSGGQKVMLRQWPVVSVASVTVDGISIPQGSATTYGFKVEEVSGGIAARPQMLAIDGANTAFNAQFSDGYRFPNDLVRSPFRRGINNVVVVYDAGFAITGEAATIAAGTVTPLQPFGSWTDDDGVTFSNGTPLTLVSSAPAAGQYSVTQDPTTLAPTYAFNAADNGKAILLNYSYVPFDLEQACIEIVGERYRTRTRIGEKSHSAGGQTTVSFDTGVMNEYVKSLLAPYDQNVILPC